MSEHSGHREVKRQRGESSGKVGEMRDGNDRDQILFRPPVPCFSILEKTSSSKIEGYKSNREKLCFHDWHKI